MHCPTRGVRLSSAVGQLGRHREPSDVGVSAVLGDVEANLPRVEPSGAGRAHHDVRREPDAVVLRTRTGAEGPLAGTAITLLGEEVARRGAEIPPLEAAVTLDESRSTPGRRRVPPAHRARTPRSNAEGTPERTDGRNAPAVARRGRQVGPATRPVAPCGRRLTTRDRRSTQRSCLASRAVSRRTPHGRAITTVGSLVTTPDRVRTTRT